MGRQREVASSTRLAVAALAVALLLQLVAAVALPTTAAAAVAGAGAGSMGVTRSERPVARPDLVLPAPERATNVEHRSIVDGGGTAEVSDPAPRSGWTAVLADGWDRWPRSDTLGSTATRAPPTPTDHR